MTTAAEKPSWGRRMLAWPRFFLSGGDPGKLYDLRGEGAIEGTGEVPLVNMGYWADVAPREERALERACYALFALVARGAKLGPEHHVIDAGCGFGTNAVYLAESTGCRVTGLNVSDVQLATARRRAAAANLGERVDFQLASVLAMPAADASVDALVSVEAAFHFDTRELFFAEAFRVLKPGGVLSMVDLVVPQPKNLWQRAAAVLVRRSQAVPEANLYDLAAWVQRLEAAGFVIEEQESIVDRVFRPFRRWMLTRPLPVLLRYDLMFIAVSAPYLVYPFDYVRVVARKPGA